MNSELVWQFALQPAEHPVGVNFKKAFYEAHLCRVLFKSIAVGDTITLTFFTENNFFLTAKSLPYREASDCRKSYIEN